LAGSVSGVVTLTGAANAGTWTFTMPTTAGTSGYILQTDGTGVTTWVASAGGGNVNSSGTPTASQIAVWTNSSTIQGITNLPVTNLNSGTGASATTFWRGDGTWATPAGGGSGTVNSGTLGQLTYYAAAGTTVSGLTTGTGVTNALGVNTGSSGALVVNGGALGTPSSGTLTNATGLPLTTGVTGNLPVTNLNSGTSASSSTFWRGDGTWATPAGGGISWQSVQTGNFTAVSGNAYPVNTTSTAITVTLPASPSAGNIVQLTDYAGTWATNFVTVAPNGAKINGGTGIFPAITARESLALVYIDATQGWLVYAGINATNPGSYIASYLVVAGGGGGGYGNGGGGGAGGLLSSTVNLAIGTTYTVTIGGGGAGSSSLALATNGSSSAFSTVSTVGGGGGGYYAVNGTTVNGASGGSGGGGAGHGISSTTPGGSGTSGQGFAGGYGGGATNYGAGGGGGSSAVGVNGTNSLAGAGGAGTASSITGSSVTYAGGGGGGSAGGTQGAGGSGGGGTGSNTSSPGTAGTANTGGGGGGAADSGTYGNGYAGGSGVVIVAVPTVFYSGVTTGSPTVTTNGAYTVLKFTASGSYTA
jgi:hypothetical protein